MPCGKSFWARKNLLRQNCAHPPANAFLIDFGVILRSKIQILQAKARRKMRKCIVVGQFGSTPVRLRRDRYGKASLPCLHGDLCGLLFELFYSRARQIPHLVCHAGADLQPGLPGLPCGSHVACGTPYLLPCDPDPALPRNHDCLHTAFADLGKRQDPHQILLPRAGRDRMHDALGIAWQLRLQRA